MAGSARAAPFRVAPCRPECRVSPRVAPGPRVSPPVAPCRPCRPCRPVPRVSPRVHDPPETLSISLSIFLSTCKWTEIWTEFRAGLWANAGEKVKKRGFRGRQKSRFPACRPPNNMTVGSSQVYISPNFKSPPRGRSWGEMVTLYISRTGYFCEISTGGLLANPPSVYRNVEHDVKRDVNL